MTDNCIVNSIKAICEMYNEDFKYYENYEYVHWSDINTWSFLECKCADHKYISTYFNQERFYKIVEYMDNAKEALERLSKKYEIIVCSMGSFANLVGKELWMKKNMPYAKFIGLNFKYHSDKTMVDMSDGIFIDDNMRYLNTNAKELICFGDKYEWNEDWKGKRCYNWIELEKYINERYEEVN